MTITSMATRATLDYAKPLQHDPELDRFIGFLLERNVRSYLEIGARYGGSFERIMTALPEGSHGVAVDFPGGNFGDAESAPILLAAIARVRAWGRKADVIFGPSCAPEVVERVDLAAPFDAMLIDGDHRYAGVKEDYVTHGRSSRIVAFHDIAAPDGLCSRTGVPVEVGRFWRELVGGRKNVAMIPRASWFPHEIVMPGSVMGFGIMERVK